MAENSNIEWTKHTFNPWEGCQKVSPGCDHCYAETRNQRFAKGANWGPKAPRRRTSAANWKQPLKWNKEAAAAGRKDRVFCASLADVFDNAIPEEWREDLWELIRSTPNLIWMLLTKRPQNIKKMLPDDWGDGYLNVWLGTTVEDQKRAHERIPHLLTTPAVKRFLSCEPLLGPVDLTTDNLGYLDCPSDCEHASWDASTGTVECRRCEDSFKTDDFGIDLVISGGESGPGSRPTHPDWHRSLRDQCAAAGVAFFFKQWGDWIPVIDRDNDDPDWRADYSKKNRDGWATLNLKGGSGFHGDRVHLMQRVGKKKAGALLDGRGHRDMPEAAT